MLRRRHFLRSGIGLAMASAAAPAALGASGRLLAFENLHTGERLKTVYWANGTLVDKACRHIDWILRDHRTGDVAPISPELLDLLYQLRMRLQVDAPFEVISGYRSPQTNAKLARAGDGVSTRSLHMRGMAIDIRVPGCPLSRLRQEAMRMKLGGVGYYPKSDFVHVDVGRVRSW